MRIIHKVAAAAAMHTFSANGLREDRVQLVVASGAALAALADQTMSGPLVGGYCS